MKANHPVDPSMAKGFDATQVCRLEQPTALQPAVDGASPTAVDIPVSGLGTPRGLQGQGTFLSIVLIAVLAVIGGATGWDDIELYAVSHQQWLTCLDLSNGADTYRRVFERVNPEALQRCFLAG